MSTITERRFAGPRRNRFAIISVGTVFVGAVALAFFVIPMQTWNEQRSTIASKAEQFAAFEDINDALQDEVDVLKTPEGIQVAIRSQLGYLLASEKRVPMLDVPNAAASLPTSWPYSVVTNILQVRIAQEMRNSGVEILNPLQP